MNAKPNVVRFSDIVKFTPRQIAAIQAAKTHKYILYGGALGGGKSFLLRWYTVYRLIQLARMGFRRAAAMLACEDYPSLKDRQISKISAEFPAWLGKQVTDHRDYGRCYILAPEYGGGVICYRNLDDPSKYQSSEFALICVDELTKNIYEVFTHLRARLRWPGLPDIECKFIGATNPGGVGHSWCKQLWMDKIFPKEWREPVDFTPLFAYVPSKAEDNPHLDSSYWSILQTLPVALRKAFRDGDWNVFVGQAFPTFSAATHVIPAIPIPRGAQIYQTFDWGYGRPFSIGWWWVDADGRIYRFSEWYGWNGQADQGLRLTDKEIGVGIKQRELRMIEQYKIRPDSIIRLAGPDIFNKKPDYMGGGQGPSTADVLAGMGLVFSPGDPSRSLKIRQFRERLRIPEDGSKPMMLIYDCCEHFIRTIPNIPTDKHNPEEVDKKSEDHVFDEACHIVMAWPIPIQQAKERKPSHEKRIDELEKPGGDAADFERGQIEYAANFGAAYSDSGVFDFGEVEQMADEHLTQEDFYSDVDNR